MATKRAKRSRIRGTTTCGYGYKKKHRGKGSKGGKGMSGTGKRSGQKHTYVLKYFPGYFGKKGFTTEKNTKIRFYTINLSTIGEKLNTFLKQGIAKKTGTNIELDLTGYKILSGGSVGTKIKIKASAFSKKAIEKLEKEGCSIENLSQETDSE